MLRRLDDLNLSRDERTLLRCSTAADLEHRGQYDAALAALAELWRGVGQRPALEGLGELTAAEVLLRAGTLSGWFGSARQLEGAQDAAKDLISESIARFDALGETARVAAARGELGFCYYRAGAYDEARVFYRDALEMLADGGEQELRATILLRLAIVESCTGRYNDALRTLTEGARLFAESADDALKGKFHNELACALMSLADAERRPDYRDRAIIEYTAAAHHFELAGHTRYSARAENNLGYLLYTAGHYEDAHEHLNRARRLFVGERDGGSVAQVDETRARVLLAEGRLREAEGVIRGAVRTLERGGEQALLAEALTTQGRVLARIGDFVASQNVLTRAADMAEQSGAVEDAGRALLSLIEEHTWRIAERELFETFQRADDLLRNTQDAETIARLRDCAARIVSVRLARGPARRERSRSDFWANFSLPERVRAYEARYIRRALIEAQGSVTQAARLLGLNHPTKLASILKGKYKDLAHLRTPPEPRRRSIIRDAAGRARAPRESYSSKETG
ncbi:MAG TPA: tetratricopeptide repeat protein [Pyrinomonadaceae bacterium]